MPASPNSWAACPGPAAFEGISFSHDPDIPDEPVRDSAPISLPALASPPKKRSSGGGAAYGGSGRGSGGNSARETENDRRVLSWIEDLADVDGSAYPEATREQRARGDPEALREATREARLSGEMATDAFSGPTSPYSSPSNRRSPGRHQTLEALEHHGLAARYVAFEEPGPKSPSGWSSPAGENPFDEAVRASAAAQRLAPFKDPLLESF